MYSRALMGYALDLAHRAGRENRDLDAVTVDSILARAAALSSKDETSEDRGWPMTAKTFRNVPGFCLFDLDGYACDRELVEVPAFGRATGSTSPGSPEARWFLADSRRTLGL